MMTRIFGIAAVLLALRLSPTDADLTQNVLEKSDVAAKLSALAYLNATEFMDGMGDFVHPTDFEEISLFNDDLRDQAIVAKKDGRCYVAFRGTTGSFLDWLQNIDTRDSLIYKDNDNTTGEACETRKGYSQFLDTDLVPDARATLLACAGTCTDLEDCVVLTGHSQGGASALILAILVHRLNPTVITFGMPPAIDANCSLVPSERTWRYVNTRRDIVAGMVFDAVPFSPTWVSHSAHYGHYILVGEDPAAAKFFGLDQNYTFEPSIFDRADILAHRMSGKPWSYASRIAALLNASSFPVSTDGFGNGFLCRPNYSELCASGACFDDMCGDKIAELCVKNSCDIEEHCESGSCISNACAKLIGAENGCPCEIDEDCVSGRCDQSFSSEADLVCADSETSPPEVPGGEGLDTAPTPQPAPPEANGSTEEPTATPAPARDSSAAIKTKLTEVMFRVVLAIAILVPF